MSLTSIILGLFCLGLLVLLGLCWRRIRLLQTDLISEQGRRLQAETELRTTKESFERERNFIDQARHSLLDQFKSAASTALEGNTRQFLELAKSSLGRESDLAKADLDKRQQSIQDLIKPLSQHLEKYADNLQTIEKDRQRTYTQIESELKKVLDSTATLSKETTSLKNALKRPHVRGRWGEVQLRNCIELAGMSEFADVHFQDVTTDAEGQKVIPDMTVRMPGGRVVVVDAKTPIDAFLNSLEAASEEQRVAELARHGRHVKEHIKRLSTRAYAESIKDSADFTVMFLPNESFLYAALETESDLVEFALQKKVLIATPPTLIGLLKVIRFGWNEEKLAENALKISEAGKELHKRLVDFVESFVGIGRSLDRAKSEYDTGLMRLQSRLLTQARRFEDLGAKSHKELPEALNSSMSEIP